ncbi:MAG TPA: restriction endonuclease subunit S [Candidatus Sulfotelmatobacter sp.]|jgi:type I restriction enzyme S subunit|nr:restriction endonuclease subunit S [Candidatus Sulfotelmatobacter sp.]
MTKHTKEQVAAHWEWPVPKSWAWVRISEVADVVGGGTPSTSRYEFWEGGEIPWITPADLTGYNEREISRGARYITQIGLDNSSARLLPARSVLFSSRAPVGYVAIAANPLATNQGFKSFVLSEGILPEYVYFYLRRAKEEITKLASGTTFVEISARACASIPLPIAPSGEQMRIVKKLEALLSRVTAGEAAARRAMNRLEHYRATVLNAAVTGELTRDWRKKHQPTETGAQLLKRLLQERRVRWEEAELKHLATIGKPPKNRKWKARYHEPIPPDTANLPKLPSGWTWASLDQLSFVVRGASPRPAGDPRYFGGKIPWITVGSLTKDSQPYLTKVNETVTEIGKEMSRFIEKGTLLLTNSGATLGVPKISQIGGCINDGVAALLAVEFPLKLYLYYFLSGQTKILQNINQGAAQPNLNTRIIRAIIVPVPPFEEQQNIIREIERRLAGAARLANTLGRQLEQAQATRQSLLREAFLGKLVPQDPKDEPASVLLEHVRTDREAEAKKPKTKGMLKPKLKFKSVETLEELEKCVNNLGTGATPERLLLAAGLGEDVEKFFDLLKAGRDKGSLVVPVGKGTAIRRV